MATRLRMWPQTRGRAPRRQPYARERYKSVHARPPLLFFLSTVSSDLSPDNKQKTCIIARRFRRHSGCDLLWSPPLHTGGYNWWRSENSFIKTTLQMEASLNLGGDRRRSSATIWRRRQPARRREIAELTKRKRGEYGECAKIIAVVWPSSDSNGKATGKRGMVALATKYEMAAVTISRPVRRKLRDRQTRLADRMASRRASKILTGARRM